MLRLTIVFTTIEFIAMFNKKLKQQIAELQKQRKEDSDLLNQQRLKIEMLQRQILNPPIFKVGDKINEFVILSFSYGLNNLQFVNRIVELFFQILSTKKVKPTIASTKTYTYTYKIKSEKTNWEMQVDEETLVELKKIVSKK